MRITIASTRKMTAVTGLAKQVPRRLAISGHDRRSAIKIKYQLDDCIC
jgi:hypothetical protein